jgi:ubiquitin C-terminal hydrolase
MDYVCALGPLQQGGERFELYASISHFGSLSSGHYTAFAKHPITRFVFIVNIVIFALSSLIKI